MEGGNTRQRPSFSLSLKQREHTFKLAFSEPSPSLLLKLPNNPTLLHGERDAYLGRESF